MIHILDFNSNIIDYISHDDGAVLDAKLNVNASDSTETFDFQILSERADNVRERNRIIVQDHNGQYREFIISHVEDTFEGITEVQCNASYLEDLKTSMPLEPQKFKGMTTSQALTQALADTGWEVSSETEYGGMRSTSWTSYNTPYDVVGMLETTFGMVADFYIELGSHTVEHRYVSLKKPNPLFKGKEITKGKDLTGLTRTVDTSEVRTALIALGPQDDKGNRISVVVKDDEAHAQFGLPGRYLWGVYEPESEDTNMTKERLTTLAHTELNKQKQMAITYEISSVDIHKYYEDVRVYLHDIVRVKDRDFNPPLYVEAEVIGVEYDLIADDTTFTFGNVVEYEEDTLRSEFTRKLDEIRKKLNDNVTNINTIVNDAIQGELEYYEPKIIKSDTEPDNPIEDMLWYDTSNPNVAVLKRYHNGEWLNETAKDVEQLGGMTREHVLYNSITNTFQNLNIQHSKLLEEVSSLLNNEYLVDSDIRNALNNAQDNLVGVYQQIKDNLDSMNEDTATIGKLIDTQALFLTYRERLQDLYRAMRDAQVSADKRLKLLQSQYTDEKFNDAMDEVARALPNGQWDSEKGQLTADFPNDEELEKLRQSLQEYTEGKISDLSSVIGEEIDSKINNTKNEISAHIGSVERKIDGLEVGGRNLLEDSANIKKNFDDEIVGLNQFFRLDITHIHDKVKLGDDITISFDVQMQKGEYLRVYDTNENYDFMLGYVQLNNIGTDKQRLKLNYKLTQATRKSDKWLLDFYNNNKADDKFTIENIKIEKGTVATDWTPAPEDMQNDIDRTVEPLKARVTNTESDIKVLQDGLRLSATKNDVEQTLNEQLKPIKNQVEENKATLDVLPNEINSKVSKEDYITDQNNVVQRLNNADSERKQLSNSIEDRVTLKQFEDMTIGGRNYLALDNFENGTFKLDDGTPIGSDPTRVRNVDYIDVEPVNYIIKVNNPLENRKIQVNFYQYDNEYNLVKNSGFVDVDDTFSYVFDSGVAKTKLLIRAEDNNDLSIEDVANAHIKLEKGTVPTDYDTDPSETSRKLTQLDTAVTQNGKDIQLRATKQEFNSTNKTLSKTISDFTNNVATGMTFTYDENGTIQSMNIGKDGIKLRGDRVDITVNKDFNVVAQNLNDKVGKDEVINRLNLSPEGLDIDVNKIGIRGGDNTNYIYLSQDKIEMAGTFQRTFRGNTQKDNVFMRAQGGYLRFRNNVQNRSLYFSDFGISTYIDGDSNEASGTLQFFDYTYSPSDSTRGVTLNSANGAVALNSERNRIVLDANATVNIESETSSVYIRPMKNTRTGNNEFAFYIKDNDSGADTDGVIKFGNVSSSASQYGSGLRFSKSSKDNIIYATDKDGNIGTGSFYGSRFYGDLAAKNDFAYVQTAPGGRLRIVDEKGYNDGNPSYQDLQCHYIQADSIRLNSNKNFYIGVSTGELWVTNNLLYNGGDYSLKDVRANAFYGKINPSSSEKFKTNITDWNINATQIVKDTKLYEYNYKSDLKEGIEQKKHGVVLERETPDHIKEKDSIDLYELVSTVTKALQEQIKRNDELEKRIEKLEELING